MRTKGAESISFAPNRPRLSCMHAVLEGERRYIKRTQTRNGPVERCAALHGFKAKHHSEFPASVWGLSRRKMLDLVYTLPRKRNIARITTTMRTP